MWMPTRRFSGEGRADPEETRRGSAPTPITIGTDRATGVVGTARQEAGALWADASVGEARDGRGVASCKRSRKGLRAIWASERVRCTGEAG